LFFLLDHNYTRSVTGKPKEVNFTKVIADFFRYMGYNIITLRLTPIANNLRIRKVGSGKLHRKNSRFFLMEIAVEKRALLDLKPGYLSDEKESK